MDEGYLLQARTKSSKINGYRVFIKILYALALVAVLNFLYEGASFYLTPYKERPHSVDYRTLRPAGIRGHGYGVIGSAMMILMLSYSLRKRTRALRNLGKLSRWLDIHIFFGITGPLLVILHTAFKVQGLVAVSFWSMVAVAASGIFGRYLYLQIPRNIQGDEVDIKELEESNRGLSARLQKDYSLSEETIKGLERQGSLKLPEGAGIARALLTVLVHDTFGRLRPGTRHGEYGALKDIPAAERRDIVRILHRKSLLVRRVQMLNQMQRLFHYWHVFHKPFAIIMYIIMVVHVTVAIWTGYRWIF